MSDLSAFVVVCPDCGTRFRATPAHLASARGLVRCGACLTVFRAGTAASDTQGEGDNDQDRLQASRHQSVLARRHEPETGAPQHPSPMPAVLFTQDMEEPPRLRDIRLPAPASRVVAALESQQQAQAARRSSGPWLIAALVLVLLGAVELIWLQLETLTAAPQTRPLLVRLCDLVGCTLAEPSDIEAIRSRRLVVRSHPERADGLRVDAIIVNRAAWPQPFPEVELRFSDMAGRLVAARRFMPKEYLAGELAGRRNMPVAVPVQISFDLLDPGPTAVNYEMHLY